MTGHTTGSRRTLSPTYTLSTSYTTRRWAGRVTQINNNMAYCDVGPGWCHRSLTLAEKHTEIQHALAIIQFNLFIKQKDRSAFGHLH